MFPNLYSACVDILVHMFYYILYCSEDEKVKSVVEKDDDGMLVNDNLSDSSNSTK